MPSPWLRFIPSEHVRILRELCDVTVTTGQDAVFEVELSHSGVTTGEWWLGDNLLQNNDLNQMSSEGRVHRLALTMVTMDESGDVAFVVGEEKSVACLLVEEKPKGEENKDGLKISINCANKMSLCYNIKPYFLYCLRHIKATYFCSVDTGEAA